MRIGKYFTTIVAIGIGSILLSSCTKRDHYNTQPTGYQNVFDEEFNNDALGWSYTNSSDSSYADVASGTYEIVDYSTKRSHSETVSTGANFNYDFQIQTSIQSNNEMALIFGASNFDNGYSFFIDNNGYYAVYYEGSSSTGFSTLIDWTATSAIKTNGFNNLEIDQVGNLWIGYINNTQVFKIKAYGLNGSQCGFMAMPGTTGYADYLTVKW